LPKADITVIAGSRASADVIYGSHLCNEVRIIVPGKMNIFQLVKTFRGFKKENFDTAIICARISPRVAQLLKLFSGIKIIAGDSLPPRKWGYTHWCPTDINLHRVECNMKILRTIFPDVQTGFLYFHIDPESKAYAERFWSRSGIDVRPVLGIHPGGNSSQKSKIYPKEKFYNVIKMFLAKFPDTRVMCFLGPEDDFIIPILSKIDERVIPVTDLPLKVVAALISKVQVFLSNNSGLGHTAAAVNVPVVTLTGPSIISSNKPWSNQNIVIRTKENLPCMPCYDTNKFGKCEHVRCLETISEKDILEELCRYFIKI